MKKSRFSFHKAILGLVISFSLFFQATASASESNYIGTVSSRRALAVRSGPGTAYPSVGELHPGRKVAVQVEGDWAKIQDGPFAGSFVNARFLKISEESIRLVTVSHAEGARLRSRPSLRARIVGSVFPGQRFSVVPAGAGWYRVVSGARPGSFIAAAALEVGIQSSEEPAQAAKQPEARPVKVIPAEELPALENRLSLSLGPAFATGAVKEEVSRGFFTGVTYQSPSFPWLGKLSENLDFRAGFSWLELSEGKKLLRFLRPQAGAQWYFHDQFFAGADYGLGFVTVEGSQSRGSSLTQGLELRVGYEWSWNQFLVSPQMKWNLILDQNRSPAVFGVGVEVGRAL